MTADKETAGHGANPAGREYGSFGDGTGSKRRAGRSEAQGNRPARNPSQPAPSWAPPRGWAAAELVDRLWTVWRRR